MSAEMVRVAQCSYPDFSFTRMSFLEDPKIVTAVDEDVDEDENGYACVLFNESLHYMLDVEQVLGAAAAALHPGGCVLLSHPRGSENVRKQRSANRFICLSASTRYFIFVVTFLSPIRTCA